MQLGIEAVIEADVQQGDRLRVLVEGVVGDDHLVAEDVKVVSGEGALGFSGSQLSGAGDPPHGPVH